MLLDNFGNSAVVVAVIIDIVVIIVTVTVVFNLCSHCASLWEKSKPPLDVENHIHIGVGCVR